MGVKIPYLKIMLEALKFGVAVSLGYLTSFGFSQIQSSVYQVNLESQNKTLKSDYKVCQSRINQIKGVVERW